MFSSEQPLVSLHNLPPDAYQRLSPCLSLLGMACTHLFSQSHGPVPEHVTALTGLNSSVVADLNAIDSTPVLQQLLLQRPLRLYDFVLVGQLSLRSPLEGPVLAFVQHQMQIDGTQLQTLLSYCLHLSEQLQHALEQHLAGPSGAAALAPLRRRQQQLQAVFTQFEATLHPQLPPVVTLGFDEARLQMLRLALLLAETLPQSETDHPFVQAVARLSSFRPEAVAALLARFGAVQPNERLGLSLPELTLLYQAMQVCGLVFVSDILSILGLENAFPTDAKSPTTSAEPLGTSRQAVGALVAGFTNWVQREFGHEPQVQQARQEVAALTDLL
ncbi:hypothetical protein [Hymenobacter sp. BT491]|uniref:hypothetical protein n=1 Tax=Hymenobacter sp. BT491 TaxID=2766779 RepID=UPI0016537F98|nr:hypothetical protein [Hymenobacter sp. BT491]MBC6990758.1 hypothetical protein [Hymenobacter sp. BT491]